MKVLLTGAFGNLGSNTLKALLLHKKYEILCFDMQNPRNAKKMEQLSEIGKFQTSWGDIADAQIVSHVVEGQECILHLAAIIPPLSEQSPDLAHRVNVGGTHNIIDAAKRQGKPPKMVFTSSISVHGNRFSEPPPRRADESVQPTDHYTHSKVASEKELMESGIGWTILRLGVAPQVDMRDRDISGSLESLFDIPLEQRMEFVHPADVATAIANSVEADTIGKILYIGGGKNCQMTNRHFQTQMLQALGIGMVSEKAFRVPKDESDYWYTDFMDTEESQRLLNFQNHSFDQYIKELQRIYGWRRIFIKVLSPIVRHWMMKKSPYYKSA